NEGYTGLVDDMALWNNAFQASSIAMLASGAATPLSLSIPEPPPPPNVIVVSNVADWTLSTESIDGGPNGTWASAGAPPPAAGTFTLTPSTTSATVMPHINNAAAALGVTGLAGDHNVHYYRTTFNLDPFATISANLLFAADNGGEVWLNGELLATEVSYLAENWTAPLPSVSIAADGGVTRTKFDSSAAAFESWLVGENELIVALRNPNAELDPAGGFALRMEITTTPVPEPSTLLILASAAVFAGAALRSRRR
ncbi:MAG: PEP-CTERM sorting domain-containing protein, partial [Pirellulales bacterium]